MAKKYWNGQSVPYDSLWYDDAILGPILLTWINFNPKVVSHDEVRAYHVVIGFMGQWSDTAPGGLATFSHEERSSS